MAFSVALMPLPLEMTQRAFPSAPWSRPKRLAPFASAGPAVNAIPVFKKLLRDHLAID
jgi:hypothetical protein